MKYHVIIPARLQSTRLPRKLLMDVKGQTVIERVYRQVLKASPESITIATDSAEIFEHVTAFGAKALMTQSTHPSGTDRIAEVIEQGCFASDDVIVNVQGDEPLIAPELITEVAKTLMYDSAPMATLCYPLKSIEEAHNPHIVKVVRDANDHALYFSRSAIPFHRDNVHAVHGFRHIGLYAYRAYFLKIYVALPHSELEQIEKLEQLRVLSAGYAIKVGVSSVAPQQDINTLDDLKALRAMHLS